MGCTVCGREKTRALGLCTRHYEEYLRSLVFAPVRQCTFGDCGLRLATGNESGRCKRHSVMVWPRPAPKHVKPPKKIRPTACSVSGCSAGGRYVKGMCQLHYKKQWAQSLPVEVQAARKAREQEYHRNLLKDPDVKKRIYTRMRAYAAANTDRKVAREHKRRARRQAGGVYTREEWQAVLLTYGGRCRICASQDKITVDHIVPLSRGGSNQIENLQPLCLSCNCAKGAR